MVYIKNIRPFSVRLKYKVYTVFPHYLLLKKCPAIFVDTIEKPALFSEQFFWTYKQIELGKPDRVFLMEKFCGGGGQILVKYFLKDFGKPGEWGTHYPPQKMKGHPKT